MDGARAGALACGRTDDLRASDTGAMGGGQAAVRGLRAVQARAVGGSCLANASRVVRGATGNTVRRGACRDSAVGARDAARGRLA